jgi:hypothetical protein
MYFRFSSSHQAICAQLATDLRNVNKGLSPPDGTDPRNVALANALQAAQQSKSCPT